MNAVEIEQAITTLAEQPFDAAEFPYSFLEAFGNKETTIRRLRKGESNKSDLGGVLQTNNIHIATCTPGQVTKTLTALRASPATTKGKVQFILATDGEILEAEDLTSDAAPVACSYSEFPDHFGFFLPLAGITTVRQVQESSFDIRATSRLNRLYVELLKDNPDWGTSDRRHEMNHFMARLIFCFFAEDTDIFNGDGIFTATIERMSARDSSNTHEVISTLFLAMNTKAATRPATQIPRWAEVFPYVNGGLFSGSTETPRFSRIARSYLLHIGSLDWKKINPDIFGSMIQAVADDDERGSLGMHYTSVPNILKVLSPLFLDDLRTKLSEADDNPRMLLNLRKRMAKIRVFDPACGSGNFLVIAYKEMRAIEAVINQRRSEADRRTEIPLTNFRGIELRDFPAEVARLALIIAEYQCDVLYRGQKEALAEFLPLDAMNWITCGNALRLDWLSVCPPTGTGVRHHADDLFHTPLDQPQIDFENEGGETYICGNPPYAGHAKQTEQQKMDIRDIFATKTKSWKSLDYVSGWFAKAAFYSIYANACTAFVATNSICQGEQVPILWPILYATGQSIAFAHTSFKWSNLASHNAGVTVAIIGLGKAFKEARLYDHDQSGEVRVRRGANINPYLVLGPTIIVTPSFTTPDERGTMIRGNMPTDGGNLVLTGDEFNRLPQDTPEATTFARRYMGSEELIGGKIRGCLWIEDDKVNLAQKIPFIAKRINLVRETRLRSTAKSTREFAGGAHRFLQIQGSGRKWTIAVARVSSERRNYLPADLLDNNVIISDLLFGIYDAPLWNLSIVVSTLHLVWIATVCGKLETRYRYSNALGWNTFPLPILTEKNKADLTRCAEDILLAREELFPATIADLYEPEQIPADLREAHNRNDEVLERIYIGRRFRNDTERLEKLFELYTRMTPDVKKVPNSKKKELA